MADAVIGAIDSIAVGTVFPDRKAAMEHGLHRSWGRGIDYDGRTGLAVAIVLNGGYSDDEDHGSYVLYTGEGGQDKSRTHQVRDQVWDRGNAALRRSHLEGSPVRVIRGRNTDEPFGEPNGYRYDGLYLVSDVSYPIGNDGFRVCRFRLDAVVGEATWPGDGSPTIGPPTDRKTTTITRVVRDSAVSRLVKRLHDHRCQICGNGIETPGGPYSEAAHVIPLGRPHDGPDRAENILCLCPNDHVRLDTGALMIDQQLQVTETATGERIARLRTHPQHHVSLESLRYHEENIASQ